MVERDREQIAITKLFREQSERTAGRSYSCVAVPHPRLAIKEEASFSEPYRVLASCLAHPADDRGAASCAAASSRKRRS